jgi:hypothetical protein
MSFRGMIFVILLAAFFVWASMATPSMPGAYRVLGYCTIIYVFGAILLCFGDFQYGLFPPKSLRPLFVIGGGALMALAVALVCSLQRQIS